MTFTAVSPRPTARKPSFALHRLGLVLALTFGGGMRSAQALPIAPASAISPLIYVERNANEGYEAFVQRATALATVTLQQQFADPSRTEAQVTLIGQSNTAVAPLLTVGVTRSNWLTRPDAQSWARTYPEARQLLGFATDAPAANVSAPAAIAPETASSVENPPTPERSRPSQIILIESTLPNPASPVSGQGEAGRTESVTSSPAEPTPTGSADPNSDREVVRLGLPSFPRESSRFRVSDDGTLLQEVQVQPEARDGVGDRRDLSAPRTATPPPLPTPTATPIAAPSAPQITPVPAPRFPGT
ncbi:MAG: hypothetical protein VKK04_19760 [Synechococcales bacterium]|nr:hypothetical protein [Synechococcales bacterium]